MHDQQTTMLPHLASHKTPEKFKTEGILGNHVTETAQAEQNQQDGEKGSRDELQFQDQSSRMPLKFQDQSSRMPLKFQDQSSRMPLKFQDQSSRMPLKKILVVYFGVGERHYLEFYFRIITWLINSTD
jgi:hypothetical protein